MTARVRHITVILDDDYREDDVQEIANAIELIRGVETTVLGEVTAIEQISYEAARAAMQRELFEFLQDKKIKVKR